MRELWALTNDAVRELRRLGINQRDRVAVVLPRGAETAVAIFAVATAAVCVPLNPDLTADELQRYFGDLQIAALLTRADMNSVSRDVAHTLGIPVIDWCPGLLKGPARSTLSAQQSRRAITAAILAASANDAFILLTSGTTSRPKMVPMTHASVCLSAYNAGAALALGPQDRLLNVLPLFHAHGLISGLLDRIGGRVKCCLPARLRCRLLLRLADEVSTDVVHRGPDNPSSVAFGSRPPQASRPAVLLAAYSFRFCISAA